MGECDTVHAKDRHIFVDSKQLAFSSERQAGFDGLISPYQHPAVFFPQDSVEGFLREVMLLEDSSAQFMNQMGVFNA
jgi:hypothetical protein